MPHVIIKMYAGRSHGQKERVAEAVTMALTNALGLGEDSISVGIEDVSPQNWDRLVYQPDIAAKPDTIFKKPGYR